MSASSTNGAGVLAQSDHGLRILKLLGSHGMSPFPETTAHTETCGTPVPASEKALCKLFRRTSPTGTPNFHWLLFVQPVATPELYSFHLPRMAFLSPTFNQTVSCHRALAHAVPWRCDALPAPASWPRELTRILSTQPSEKPPLTS